MASRRCSGESRSSHSRSHWSGAVAHTARTRADESARHRSEGTARTHSDLVTEVCGPLRDRISRRPPPARDVEWRTGDIATGEGLNKALDGADAVIHLASAPYRRSYTATVEIDGTRHLLGAAKRTGVRHVVFTSIVGADMVRWGYFRTKVEAEGIIASGPVPWSILRATQFHEFLDQTLSSLSGLGFLATDRGICVQPVDVRDLAARLVRAVEKGASKGVSAFGGPKTHSMDEAVRKWRTASSKRRPILRVRVPGRLGRGFRAGYLTTAEDRSGQISWDDYLAERYG